MEQMDYIEKQRKLLQLSNVDIVLADITIHEMVVTFDRIMVVGLLVPIDEDDWYTEYVFPAGSFIIPSASFLLNFQSLTKKFVIIINGTIHN
ncbi:hypothetical protein AAC387_Pa01g3060 [Persea americana]